MNGQTYWVVADEHDMPVVIENRLHSFSSVAMFELEEDADWFIDEYTKSRGAIPVKKHRITLQKV